MSRERKKHRQARAGQRHGRSAYARHRGRSGRTGNMHAKKTPPKKREPYVGAPARSIADSARCPECGARPGEIHRHEEG